MGKRISGRPEPEVAPLAFGGNVFGWRAEQVSAFRLLDAIPDAGFLLIGTAEVHSDWIPRLPLQVLVLPAGKIPMQTG